MEYTFVLKDKGTINQGWWLKISNIKELENYYELIDNDKMLEGVFDASNCNEFDTKFYLERLRKFKTMPCKPHCKSVLALAIGFYGSNNHISALDAAVFMQQQKLKMQIDALKKGDNVYINQNGGWHSGKNDYSDWCHKKEIVFPKFKKNQIKIESFPGGRHFYAYIDSVPVRDGDIVKWDTYEEAYKYASSLIQNNEK